MKRRHLKAMGGLALVLLLGGSVAARLAAMDEPGVRTLAVDAAPRAVAVDAATGRAFVISRPTNFAAFSATSSEVSVVDTDAKTVLHAMATGPFPRAVAVDPRRGHALVITEDGLSVLDARTGALLHTIAVGSLPRAVAVDATSGRAFVVNAGDGPISIVDTQRAAVLRTVRIDPAAADGAQAANPPGLSGNTPRVAAPYQAYYPYGGFFGGYFQTGIVADERTGRVFVAALGAVGVFDARTWALLRTVPVPGYAGRMAVDGRTGQVYVASGDGVAVLDGHRGKILRRLGSGSIRAVAVDAPRHRLFVIRGDPFSFRSTAASAGAVTILDGRSGAVLRTMPVGLSPVGVAVDERTGRAVVANAGGPVEVRDGWTWIPPSLRRWIPFHAPQSPEIRWVAGSVSVVDTDR